MPDPSAIEQVHHREQRHVGHVAAQQVADGQVRGVLDHDRADRHGEFGQRGRGRHQHHADEESAEAGDVGDAIARLRQDGAGADDDGRHQGEEAEPEDQVSRQSGAPWRAGSGRAGRRAGVRWPLQRYQVLPLLREPMWSRPHSAHEMSPLSRQTRLVLRAQMRCRAIVSSTACHSAGETSAGTDDLDTGDRAESAFQLVELGLDRAALGPDPPSRPGHRSRRVGCCWSR